MAKSLKRHPTNMADKHMKRCSIWLVIREMQVKSTIRHQYIHIYVSFLKSLKSDHSTVGEDIKKKNLQHADKCVSIQSGINSIF